MEKKQTSIGAITDEEQEKEKEDKKDVSNNKDGDSKLNETKNEV